MESNVVRCLTDTANVGMWRHEACELARQFLCSHADVTLRPRLQRDLQEHPDLSVDVFERAFLDHRKHAGALIIFLLNSLVLLAVVR